MSDCYPTADYISTINSFNHQTKIERKNILFTLRDEKTEAKKLSTLYSESLNDFVVS